MDSLHIGNDSGMETGSTSMNSVRERSSCETSCVDSADTYNFAENISSEDEEKITSEYNISNCTDAQFDNRRPSNETSFTCQYDNDISGLDIDDPYTKRYTNKCDEYSGRASGSKSNTEKSMPKHKPMELVVSHSSQTLVLKSSGRIMSDEHDTYSPEEDLSFIRHEESAAMTPDELMLEDVVYLVEDQNKKYDQSLQSVVSKSSTKEEKQRQNEEIVNLESSSISSETGSWESVFPMRSNQEARDMCATFLSNEKDFCSRDVKINKHYQSYPMSRHSTPVKYNACFIDASSLVDDGEMFVNQPLVWQTNQNETNNSIIKSTALNFPEHKHSNPINVPVSLIHENNKHKDSRNSSSSSQSEQSGVEFFQQQDLDFHTRFEKCKTIQSISTPTTKISAEILLDNSNDFSNNLHENNLIGMTKLYDSNFEYQGLNDEQLSETNTDNGPALSERQSEINSAFTLNGAFNNEETEKNSVINEVQNINLETTIILPDTPHNSIVEIESSQNRNSDSPFKSQKYAETTPIISGGASVEDFVPKIRGSPMIRRKLENTPILSGGGVYELEEKIPTEKPKRRISNSAWVVDMSDCSSTSSLDSKINRDDTPRRDSTSSHKSSLGFFIHFGDEKSKTEDCLSNNIGNELKAQNLFQNKNEDKNNYKSDNSSDDSKEKSSSEERRSLGYFIDLSQDNKEPDIEKPPATDKSKNMFSMFIDFGEKYVKNIPDRLATSLHSQRTRSKSIAIENNGNSNVQDKEQAKVKNGFAKTLSRDKSNSLTKKNCKASIVDVHKSLEHSNAVSNEIFSGPQKNPTNFVSLRNLDKTPDEVKKTDLTSTFTEKNGKTSNEGLIQVCRRDKINLKQLKAPDFDKEIANKTNDDSAIGRQVYDVSNDTNRSHNNPLENREVYTKFQNISSQFNDNEPNKRHSWNQADTPKVSQRLHKRAQSVSENNIVQNEVKLKVGSTYSIDSNLSEFSGRSGLSSGSSSGYARMSDVNKKHKKDCKINETFDKSSPGSQTEGVLTDTEEDLTYQNEQIPEEMCENEKLKSVVKNVKSPIKDPQTDVKIGYTLNIDDDESLKSPKKSADKIINSVAHTMETLQAKIEKQKQLLATVSENTEMNNENLSKTVMTDSGKFVRLSDMDKPLSRMNLINDKLMSSSTGSNRVYKLFANNYENKYFMSRSIGNHTNLITSEENSRSLSRLFPHLSKGFSSSLPNGVNANLHFNRSPLELDDFTSDISVGSSLSSSMGKSGMDLSAEDSLSRQPRRLGEDLLRMFLEEISPDVSIDVSGRVLRAHKCILRSRCQYFAATLAGNEVETRGNVIVMDGYTYGAVHFALCHIYSGATRPPEGISLQELASLADLLGLEGLKEVTAHALKTTYCHMFHKPCDECIAGVCLVLPLAAGHGLDELHARCVRWLCRHFLRVWPTRSFATLSSDLMERARRHIIAHLTAENVLGTVLDCECLLSELPEARWASRVEALTLSLLEHAHMFVADKFPAILTANSFLSLGGLMWRNVARLRTTLNEAACSLAPEQACRSYHRLARLGTLVSGRILTSDMGKSPNHHLEDHFGDKTLEKINQIQIENDGSGDTVSWHPEFVNLVEELTSSVEHCLAKQGSRATRAISWSRLEPKLRKRIQELMTANGNGSVCGSSHNNMRIVSDNRNRSPRTARSTSSTRSQDLKQIRQVIHANATRALSQDNNKHSENITQYRDPSINFISKQNITKNQNNVATKCQNAIIKNQNNIQKSTFEKNLTLRNFNKTFGGISKSSSNKSIPVTNTKLTKTSGKDLSKPDLIKTINRPRSQSEVIVKTNKSSELKALSARVAHAKPRYLEPRKRDLEQTPIKKNQNMKNKILSSSETSRTPSPRNRYTKKGESSNMSLDSLASSQKLKTMSTDSLIPTMDESDNRLSCVKTNITSKNKPSIDTKSKIVASKIKNLQKIPVKTNVKLSRTLTSPTKSSAAKMVVSKKKVVNDKKNNSNNSATEEKYIPQKAIPQMERSGTFVKELATE